MTWLDLLVFFVPILACGAVFSHWMAVHRPPKQSEKIYRIRDKKDGFSGIYIDPFVFDMITAKDGRYIVDIKTVFGWKTLVWHGGDGLCDLAVPYCFDTEKDAKRWMGVWKPDYKMVE